MNFNIFLILLGIIRLIFSARSNNTGDDSCNVCTFSFFRRKRANTEYTRWHANPETKQEFIVKVLEDDLSTAETKQIAAVNIQPITKAQEKIIIRGAIVPTTKESTLDLIKEYTRFVPPTTLSVTRVNGNILIAPVKPIVHALPPVRPHGAEIKHGHSRNLQRDNSPVNLQLLPKSQTLVARQYAPIAAVSFTRRNTVGPLTPRTVDRFMFFKTTVRPTRTSSYLDVLVPLRTSELVNFLSFKYSTAPSNKVFISRSTLIPIDLQPSSSNEDPSIDENKIRKYNLENKNIDKDLDTPYNDLFYNNEDYNERTTKNLYQIPIDNYDDNNKTLDDNDPENHFISKENRTKIEESKNNREIAHSYVNYEDDDIVNATVRCIVGNNSETITPKSVPKTLKSGNDKKNLNCTVLKLRQLSFSSPLTLFEIVTQLRQWAEESPVAKWMDITKGNYTVMENPIYMMIVDDPSSGQIVSAKQTVMIVAGIQGRDHHAVTAAMYVLYQLIERSEAHSDLLTKFRFWIIPVFNPDGYDYSMTFPHRREWSKNLRQSWESCIGRDSCQSCEEFGIRCTIQPCYGVNLDRNFEYQWIPAEELRAEHPCGSLYAGPRQLSEAETQALTHFLHEQRSPLYTFIAFKEGDVLGIMYPYSHTRKKRAFDHVYRQRASRAASAAFSISGRPYVAGQTSEFLPLYAGGIEDWVDGHLGIDNTYTVMMFRPTDSQNSKLVTERVVHEAYAAVDTLLLQSVEPLGPPVITLTRAMGSRSTSISMPLTFLVIVVKLEYG